MMPSFLPNAAPSCATWPRCGARTGWCTPSRPSRDRAVLAYLARYTYRVAISNRRLLAMDERGVTFRYKDYRRDGAARHQSMTLPAAEFIRRFLLHVLPKGFHRLRHYGLLASASRKANLARIRDLLAVPQSAVVAAPTGEVAPEPPLNSIIPAISFPTARLPG